MLLLLSKINEDFNKTPPSPAAKKNKMLVLGRKLACFAVFFSRQWAKPNAHNRIHILGPKYIWQSKRCEIKEERKEENLFVWD